MKLYYTIYSLAAGGIVTTVLLFNLRYDKEFVFDITVLTALTIFLFLPVLTVVLCIAEKHYKGEVDGLKIVILPFYIAVYQVCMILITLTGVIWLNEFIDSIGFEGMIYIVAGMWSVITFFLYRWAFSIKKDIGLTFIFTILIFVSFYLLLSEIIPVPYFYLMSSFALGITFDLASNEGVL